MRKRRYCSLRSQQPMHRNCKTAVSRMSVSGLSRRNSVKTPCGDSERTVTARLLCCDRKDKKILRQGEYDDKMTVTIKSIFAGGKAAIHMMEPYERI